MDHGARAQVTETVVPITADNDIVTARQHGRAFASLLGFSAMEATLIATAISELARNIVLYATHGEIGVAAVEKGGVLISPLSRTSGLRVGPSPVDILPPPHFMSVPT